MAGYYPNPPLPYGPELDDAPSTFLYKAACPAADEMARGLRYGGPLNTRANKDLLSSDSGSRRRGESLLRSELCVAKTWPTVLATLWNVNRMRSVAAAK